jgi:hypothetical protein
MKTLKTLILVSRPAVPALALGLGSFGFAAPSMTVVSRADLCVTEGAIQQLSDTRLSVDAAKMRAYLNTPTQQSVEAHFTYMGPTADEVRLCSGELRRQFGLKLCAGCLQPGVRDVANPARLKDRGLRQIKSPAALEFRMRQSWISQYQAAARRKYRRSLARQAAHPAGGNARCRIEGVCRQLSGLGGFLGIGRAGLGGTPRHSLGQRPAGHRASRGRASGRERSSSARVSSQFGRCRIALRSHLDSLTNATGP